jgi:uroporphyrinogen III methyltransferase/synthase
VFARGGEEAQALVDAGVPFEVVPGITSAIAVPAYAGIPVTMRHSSTSFTVVTGHEDPATAEHVDWDAVARVGGTIVVLMGVGRIRRIAERLLAAGLPPETPAAAVRWGTRPEQHTIRATLATIADQPLESPSVIVVGRVAAVDVGWFERRPLFGRTVVVTRAQHQAAPLVGRLRALGADTVEVPAIEIGDPADGGAALREAVGRLGEYDWVIFTSVNGVKRTLAEVPDARAFGGCRIAAIGPGTADALTRHRLAADLVPERYVAESLLDAFAAVTPGRALLPRAAVAREVLPDELRSRGWEVDVVEAYRTEPGRPAEGALAAARAADAITFTSSSTVAMYLQVVGRDAVPPLVACIGPVTAATAREHGLTVGVEAEVHTVDGLVDALVEALTG